MQKIFLDPVTNKSFKVDLVMVNREKALLSPIYVKSLPETWEECEHKNTVDIGDEDHISVACTDCSRIL